MTDGGVLVQVVLQLSFLISCLVLIPFPENFVDPRGVVQPRGGGKARADVGEERVCEAVDVDAVHLSIFGSGIVWGCAWKTYGAYSIVCLGQEKYCSLGIFSSCESGVGTFSMYI